MIDLDVFENLNDAKARRDLVRDQIVRLARSLLRPTPELAALLRADDLAAIGLRNALVLADPTPSLYPIPDSLTEPTP